jgi:hypothetical protein
MPRLPIPGEDDGTWGGLLNDFLSQSMDTDGTLKTGVVGQGQLQNNSVTSAAIADGAVGANQLAAGAVTTSTLATGAVTSLTLADNAVGANNISAGAVTGSAIASDAVGESQMADGAITTVALANGAVTNSILAADSVGLTNLQNNAITTAKLADGSVTSGKLAPGITGSTTNGLRELLIFYSAPNIINLQYDDNYASGVLSRYDDVVLGEGLEDPGNAYYASTSTIISNVASLSPDTVIWGYIDCGVTTSNYPLGTLETQIDQWMAIGAKGIFCDTFGYDYEVPRSRQNSIISYIHSQGVGAILNVFNSNDALSSAVNVTYNPSGTPTVANSTDVLLLESWICNTDAYTSPYYATISDLKTRGDAAVAYKNSLGIRLFAANIVEQSTRTFSEIQAFHDVAEALARAWRLDGSGIGASEYSSSGADVGLATPMFSSFKPIQMRPNAPYILNGSWTQVQAPDLGITVTYDATDDIYSWTQQ